MDVVRKLERQIREGTMERGSRIAGERDLSKKLGVSRVTLRKALQELRGKGLLVANRARGWFVAAASVEEKNILRSFTELARACGIEARSKVLAAVSRMASVEETEIFQTPAGAVVFEVSRVRCMGTEPIGVETSRVLLALCPAIEKADLTRSSIHKLLETSGAAPASADYALTAVTADATTARLLNLEIGFPLLSAEAITRDINGTVVELSTTVFRGDRYRFHTTLRSR